jgi:hypothetical protein
MNEKRLLESLEMELEESVNPVEAFEIHMAKINGVPYECDTICPYTDEELEELIREFL